MYHPRVSDLDRLESERTWLRRAFTAIGETVNLAQRLQQWGEGGQTVLSEPTYDSLDEKPDAERIPPALVKGRETPVGAYRIGAIAQ